MEEIQKNEANCKATKSIPTSFTLQRVSLSGFAKTSTGLISHCMALKILTTVKAAQQLTVLVTPQRINKDNLNILNIMQVFAFWYFIPSKRALEIYAFQNTQTQSTPSLSMLVWIQLHKAN